MMRWATRMFESLIQSHLGRTLSSRAVAIGIGAPVLFSIGCFAWSAVGEDHGHEAVPGAPFRIWIAGLITLGVAVSFATKNLSGSAMARIGLAIGYWLYLLAIAAFTCVIGFFVLYAAE